MTRIHWLDAAKLLAAGLTLLLCGSPCERAAYAQFRVGPPIMVGPTTRATAPTAADEEGEAEQDAGALRVDPEIEALRVRAAQLTARREYDLAATLWQKLLDESGHHLMRAADDRFEPLREQVFRQLAKLPPEALRDYRVTADGEARGLLATAGDDPARREVALAEVVRRYFVSSLGDDAAYELAGVALDRRDFVTASRLARAILSGHPDPDVPRAPLLLRQAVADAYLGDKKSVDVAFERLAKLPPRDRQEVDLDAVRDYVTRQILPRRGALAQRQGGEESRVSTTIGRSQPTLAAGLVRGPLTEHLEHAWSLPNFADAGGAGSGRNMMLPSPYAPPTMFMLGGSRMIISPSMPPAITYSSSVAYDVGFAGITFEESTTILSGGDLELPLIVPHVAGGSSLAVGELTDEERRGALVARWRQRGWHPTVQCLPVGDGFVFRSHEDVSYWQVVQGGLKQRWRSASKNLPLPMAWLNAAWIDGPSGAPISGSDSVLFGDGIALATVVHDRRVYTLEGPRAPQAKPGAQPSGAPAPGLPAPGAPGARPPIAPAVEIDDEGRVIAPAAKPGAPPEKPDDATRPADPAKPSEAGEPVAPKPEPGAAGGDGAGPRVTVVSDDGTVVMSGEIALTPEGGPAGAEQSPPGRQRRNFLAAYDQQTGTLAWRRAAAESATIQRSVDEPEGPCDEAGFVGPPTAWNDRLLVPVVSGGTYAVMAIQASDGATLWRTPLGDEPDSGANLRSPVSIAISGGDAYVVLGAGMVFALDVRSGALHWGASYSRDLMRTPPQPNPWGGPATTNASAFYGWDSDLAIVSGNLLLVLASDHDQLLALDRRSGAVRWRSPRRLPSGTSVRYPLGVSGRRLFVAGVDVVRAYDLPSGRLDWEQSIPPTSARGCLTAQAIFLPILGSVDGAVLALDPATGRELGQSAVTLSTPEPLGNLHTDGQRLWSAGTNRIYALTHVPAQLERLSAGVEARRPDDIAQRARLLARLKRFDEALADARLARDLLAKDDPHEAAEVVLDLLMTSRLAHERPRATLSFLAEPLFAADAPQDATPNDAAPPQEPADGRRELLLAREQLIRAALGSLQRKPAPDLAAELLRLAPDWIRASQVVDGAGERIITAAARAVDRCTADSDLDALRAAVSGNDATRRRVALPAFVARASEADLSLVDGLLSSDDVPTRLTAAQALADLKGRRTALVTLVQLLEAPDVAVRRAALHVLRRAAGTASPPLTLDARDERRAKGLAAWKAWVAARSADEPPPASADARYTVLDRTLVSIAAPEALVEFDASGVETWRTSDVLMPVACAGTDEGHRLVLIHGGRQIVEFDAQGERIWQSGLLPHPAASVERLADGATLVACPQRDLLLEIAPDGHVLAKQAVRGGPSCTQRLDDRRTLVTLAGAGRVVEVTRTGQTVWEAAEWPNAAHAQRLTDGRTLLTQTKFNTVGGLVLLDRAGQNVAWQRGGLRSIGGALRFADGTTIYSAEAALVLLAPDGQQAWTKPLPQVTGIAAN